MKKNLSLFHSLVMLMPSATDYLHKYSLFSLVLNAVKMELSFILDSFSNLYMIYISLTLFKNFDE